MDSLDDYNFTDHILRNMVEERVGRQQVMMAIAQLAAAIDQNRWIWKWSDGYGGWVKDTIQSQIVSLGLDWEPQRESRPDKGSRGVVLERDNYECQNCGWHDDLQIDHIMPRSRGGSDLIDNLQVLCAKCNRSKRAKTMEEWEACGDAEKMRNRETP